MEKLIKTFLEVIDFPSIQNMPEGFIGNGTGYGCGTSEYTDGKGNGRGSGEGSGSFTTKGNGLGQNTFYINSNDNILTSVISVEGSKIYIIDEIPTTIDSIKGNIAQGRILNADMTWKPCYIVRVENSFAHGETSHEAFRDATQKSLSTKPLSIKLQKFKKRFPSLDDTAKVSELYNWHNTLTGSCKMGRKHWCSEHGYNVDTDISTIRNFLEETKDSFGSNIITMLLKLYEDNQ